MNEEDKKRLGDIKKKWWLEQRFIAQHENGEEAFNEPIGVHMRPIAAGALSNDPDARQNVFLFDLDWLVSQVEEAQAELAKVKGQRDRLADMLLWLCRRQDMYNLDVYKATYRTSYWKKWGYEIDGWKAAEKALAELEKET